MNHLKNAEQKASELVTAAKNSKLFFVYFSTIVFILLIFVII